MQMTKARFFAVAVGALSLPTLLCWNTGDRASAGEQAAAPRPQLHGVLSHQPLSPLLLSTARRVRFSPNGAYILVQDDAGLLVFTREPLSLRLSVSAPRALPARFSTDSKFLIVATPALTTARYELEFPVTAPAGPMLVPKGCLSSAISADGEMAACYDPEYRLHIVRTAGGEEVFSDLFGSAPPSGTPIHVPRGTESAFAEPFGYFSAASLKAWMGRRDFGLHMAFSPDGKYLLARDLRGGVIAVDVAARKKLGVPDSFKNHLTNTWCFVAPDRIVSLDPKKKGNSAVLAFPKGERKLQLQTAGTEVELLSEPRYLRIEPPDDGAPLLFDLETRAALETLPQGASDILAGVAATYSVDGEMLLTKLGEKEPLARMSVPFNPLPTLRTAIASPNLQSLALAGREVGGVYDVATGKRVAHLPRMNGAWFADEEKLYVRFRLPDGSLGPVQRLELKSGNSARAWSEKSPVIGDLPRAHEGKLYVRSRLPDGSLGPEQELELKSGKSARTWSENTSVLGDLPGDDVHPAGPVLLVDSPAGLRPDPGQVGIQLRPTSAYELHARAIENGSRLWSRKFLRDVPVPFADPQGDRFLLAWAATSEVGRNETKSVSNLPGHEKASRLSEHDTLFEVFDARSGKLLGGALAQIGAGPENFESAFSVGDSLILVKDDQRITVFSLSTGRQTARFFGSIPAASAAAKLLVAADGGRLTLFDLATGAKRDELVFPDPVGYSHFSADGRRLLVLTVRQMLYVLDVSAASSPPLAPSKP